MEPLNILRAHPLDLLFENRNKDYGAYTLRKYYTQRLVLSLALVISIVILICSFYLYFGNRMISQLRPDLTGVISLELVEPPAPPRTVSPPSRPASPRPPSTTAFSTPVIVNDQPHQSAMPDITQLESHAIGLQTTLGDGDINQSSGGGNGQGTIVNGTDSSESNLEIFEHPEEMPEFPGGPEGLKRYLQKNLRMPENNLEPGAQVKVIARFVVESDGGVRNVEITNDVEDLFSREVKRVILKMPEWKPGKQHNRNVAVYFSLPVNFVAEE